MPLDNNLADGTFYTLSVRFEAVMSPLVAEVLGTLSHGVNYGMAPLLSHTGGTIGPLVTGLIFDVTQSYQLAFLILFVSNLGGLILTSILKPVNIKGPKYQMTGA